jgi:glycosyltransferase involved in cell wall biosynthesis
MRQKLFFTVVIPTLNEEKYLPVILDALGQQTFRLFELVVVDGKSKDKTKRMFDKYSFGIPQSVFIYSDKANVGHQRNLGAKKAQGEFLVFLDADVNIDATFLDELHILIIKKNLKMATTWIKSDSDSPPMKFMILIANLVNELVHGLNRPYTGGYNTIIRKDCFLKLKGFREDLKINEDVDFALYAFKKGIKCELLKEPLVTFSLRRFRAKGILPAILNIAHGNLFYFTKLYKKIDSYNYPMGGQAHEIKKKKDTDVLKLKTVFAEFKKIGKLFTD